MNIYLPLHIVLQKPPANVAFGPQKGSGNTFEAVQVQYSSGEDLHFDLTFEIKGDRGKDTLPDFKGPFVQGPKMTRFIYIDIGAIAGQAGEWSRRLKIPLSGISWNMIEQVSSNHGAGLETYVPGTAKDGTPNCATVKPFNGWQMKTL